MAGFFREALSEDGQASASRIMMLLHGLIGGGSIIHVVHHTHALPDAVSVAGITAFVTAPYAVNKLHAAVTAFASNNKSP